MPQVPYVDHPTQAPSGGGLGPQNINPPAGAFGAGLGEAQAGLGREVSSIGSILEKHALAMQSDINEADVNKGATGYIIDSAGLTEQFKLLQGKDAAAAMPKYQQDLEAIRQKYRGELSNPMAQKMYDQQTMRQFAYRMEGAASHSAIQMRSYQNGAALARKDIALQQSAAANTEEEFNSAMKDAEEAIKSHADFKGAAPEVQQDMLMKTRAEAMASRLTAMAQTNPNAARDYFDKHRNELGTHIQNVQNAIDNGQVRDTSREIAKRAVSGLNAPGGPVAKKFIGTLKAEGVTNPYALAAVAATGVSETGFDEAKVNASWSDPSESGEAGTSGGILSWRNERLRAMQSFVSRQGGDPVVAQAKFFMQENPDLIKELNAAKSPEEAAALMADAWKFKGFDRPGGERAARERRTRDLLGQGLTQESTEKDLESAVNAAKASVAMSNVPDYLKSRVEDSAVSRVQSEYGTIKRVHSDAVARNWETVLTAVRSPTDNPMDGPKSYDDLPVEGKRAYDQLPQAKQKQVDSMFVHNTKADYPRTKEKEDLYWSLRGQAATGTPEQQQAFQHMDVSSLELPRTMENDLRRRQIGMNKNVENRTHLQAVLSYPTVQGILRDNSIQASNKRKYEQFAGYMEDAIEQWKRDNPGKTYPNEADGAKIAAQLTRKVTTPGAWFGTNEVPAFQETPPAKFTDYVTQKYKETHGGAVPDAKAMQRFWVNETMQNRREKWMQK
jgi:hypothetical protein